MAKKHSTQEPPPPTICQVRQLKVNQIAYMHKRKDDPAGGGRPVPWIQLKGQWLLRAGFAIDQPITVRVMERCLVVTVREEDEKV